MHPIISGSVGTTLGRRAARAGRRAVRPHRRVGRRPGARAPAAPGVPLLAQQPHGHGPRARRRGGGVCRGRAGHRGRGRGVRRVRPARDAQRPDAARGTPAARGDPHDEQGLRVRRGPPGLPRCRPRARGRAAAGAAAVPPVGADPGDRGGGAAPRVVAARRPSRSSRPSATGSSSGWPSLGLEPVPSDANFVLFGGLSDAAQTWRDLLDRGVLVRDVGIPHYLRVTAGTPAETDAFLAAMAEIAPQATDTGNGQERVVSVGDRTVSLSRSTSESSVQLELNLDGSGVRPTSTRACASTTTCSPRWPSTR